MKNLTPLLAAALALATASAGIGQDAAKIEWKPKVGDTAKVKITIVAKTDGSSGFNELRFVMDGSRTVKEIHENGNVTTQSTQRVESAAADGIDITAMVPQEESVSETVVTARGVPVMAKDGGEELPTPRMTDAMAFVFPDKPIKVGESWTREHEADPESGMRSSKCVYTYQGIEQSGKWLAYKVAVKFEEREGPQPISHTSTVWVSIENGDHVMAKYDITNAILGGIGVVDAVVTSERIE